MFKVTEEKFKFEHKIAYINGVFIFSSFIIHFKKIYANYGKADQSASGRQSDNTYHKVYSDMRNQHKHLLQTYSLASTEVQFVGKFEY